MATLEQREGEEARRMARAAADMATERVDMTRYSFVCDEFAEELAARAEAEGFTIDVGTDAVEEAFEDVGYELP
jgi:hypothetical protein